MLNWPHHTKRVWWSLWPQRACEACTDLEGLQVCRLQASNVLSLHDIIASPSFCFPQTPKQQTRDTRHGSTASSRTCNTLRPEPWGTVDYTILYYHPDHKAPPIPSIPSRNPHGTSLPPSSRLNLVQSIHAVSRSPSSLFSGRKYKNAPRPSQSFTSFSSPSSPSASFLCASLKASRQDVSDRQHLLHHRHRRHWRWLVRFRYFFYVCHVSRIYAVLQIDHHH